MRTACLTCIGAIIGIKPPLMEVSQLIKPSHNPVGVASSIHPSDSPLFRPQDASYLLYPSFSSPKVPSLVEENLKVTENPCNAKRSLDLSGAITEKTASDFDDVATCSMFNAALELDTTDTHANEKLQNWPTLTSTKMNPDAEIFQHIQETQQPRPMDYLDDTAQINENGSRSGFCTGLATPVLGASSGMATPVYSDQLLQKHARETSWVIKLCIKNITGELSFLYLELQ